MVPGTKLSKCLDVPAMNQLYGTEPVFIFDPGDDSNRPVPGYQDNAIVSWPIYPQFLRDLFTKSFTSGIKDPKNGRVRESEWRIAMVKLRDSIIYCQKLNGAWHQVIKLLFTLSPFALSSHRPISLS